MILFEHHQLDFSSRGICTLQDSMNENVIEELNGAFELEFDYPIDSPTFKYLMFRRIVYCKPNPYTNPQAFRIYEMSTPINGIVSVSCHHISYDLTGHPIEQFTATSISNLCDRFNSSGIVISAFAFNTDIESDDDCVVQYPTTIRSVMGDEIMSTYSPEYIYDNWRVDLLKKRGTDTQVVIKYGVNLVDFTQEQSILSVFTDVFPFWTNHGNNDVDIIKTLPEKLVPTPGQWDFKKVMIYDMSSEFQEEPSEQEMRTHVEKYIKDNEIGIPMISMDVSFLHLHNQDKVDKIMLGDTVTVKFVKAKVNTKARCIKTEYNPRLDKYTSIELGQPKPNLANTIVGGFNDTNNKINDTKTYVDTKVDQVVNGDISASSIKTGTLTGKNDKFKLNVSTGDYAFGTSSDEVEHTPYRSKWSHRDGEISTIGSNGFYRENRPYLNNIHTGVVTVGGGTNSVEVILPSYFIGKAINPILQLQKTVGSDKTVSITDISLKVESINTQAGSFRIAGGYTTLNSNTPLNKAIEVKYTVIG